MPRRGSSSAACTSVVASGVKAEGSLSVVVAAAAAAAAWPRPGYIHAACVEKFCSWGVGWVRDCLLGRCGGLMGRSQCVVLEESIGFLWGLASDGKNNF